MLAAESTVLALESAQVSGGCHRCGSMEECTMTVACGFRPGLLRRSRSVDSCCSLVVSMLELSRRAQDIYAELDQLNTYHYEVDMTLRRVPSRRPSVRYLCPRLSARHRERERSGVIAPGSDAVSYESNMGTRHRTAGKLVRDRLHDEQIARACRRISTTTGRPSIRSWTGRRSKRSSDRAGFLRREVLPRREAVLAIAEGN